MVTKKRWFGIRLKVILALVGGLIVSLSINAWFSIQEQNKFIEDEIQRNGSQLSRVLARSLVNYVVSYDYHSIQLYIDEVTKNDIAYIKVSSRKGNVMAQTKAVSVADEPIRTFSRNIVLSNNTIGKLELGLNTTFIIQKVQQQNRWLVTREVGVILFIILIVYVSLSALIMRPISKFTAALSKNTGQLGLLPAAIDINSRDEFGDMAEKFNFIRHQLNTAHEVMQGEVDLADRKLSIANEKLLEKSQSLEESNKELSNQAVTDPLTGLFNRRKFQSILKSDIENCIAGECMMSMIVLDIDHFKKVNDQYGHDVGDRVLQEVALQMEENTRKNDVVCRIGGEEFAILCFNVGQRDAYNIAEKLRMAVASCVIATGSGPLSVTISLGITTSGYKQHDLDPEALFREADTALYESKNTGRNKTTHFTQIDNVAASTADVAKQREKRHG